MKRSLLGLWKMSSLVCLALAIGCSTGQNQPPPAESHPAAAAPFDLEETTIATLLNDQESGRRTARSIVEQYLARIEAIDRSGPTLRSVLEVNPEALAIGISS